MAKFFADVNGAILRFAVTPFELGLPDPAGTVWRLEFDGNTNGGLVAAYNTSPGGPFTMPGGTLTQTVLGVPTAVTINAPGLAFTDRELIAAGLAKLFDSADNLSTAEQQALFRDHLRRTGQAPPNR